MKEEIYDHIFIGTGPIPIIEALSQTAQEKKVLLIDRADRIGGAWRTTVLPNGEDVEIGCHIWSISKPVFRFLGEYLDIDMTPLKPQPIIYKNQKNIPYDWKSNVVAVRRMLQNIKNGRLKHIFTDWRLPVYRLAIFPSKYFYPLRGSTAFAEALNQKVNEAQIEVLLNKEIKSLHNKKDQVDVFLANGETIKANNVFMTSVSDIDSLVADGKEFTPHHDVVRYIHVHLDLTDNEGKIFSYVRWLGDDTIHRISDITRQAKSDLKRLLIVGVYEKAYDKDSEEEIMKNVMNKLRSHGFIGENTQVKSWQFNVFPTFYIERDQYNEILDAFDGKLQILASTDLIYAMHHRLEDWNASLLGNSK